MSRRPSYPTTKGEYQTAQGAWTTSIYHRPSVGQTLGLSTIEGSPSISLFDQKRLVQTGSSHRSRQDVTATAGLATFTMSLEHTAQDWPSHRRRRDVAAGNELLDSIQAGASHRSRQDVAVRS